MRRAIVVVLFVAACGAAPTIAPGDARVPTEQEFAAAVSVVATACAVIPQCQPKLCIRGVCATCTTDHVAGAGRCVLDTPQATCDGWWTRGSHGGACSQHELPPPQAAP